MSGLPEVTAAGLRSRIREGEWRPGERLPAEPDLAERVGVSRATLRDAIRVLEQDGYLRRAHGSGTYVTQRPLLRNNLEQNFGVTDLIEEFGMRPGTRERSLREEPADAEVAEGLGVAPGTPVHALRRVRTAGGEPIVLSADFWAPAVLDPARLDGHRSLYAALQAAGHGVHHGVARIRPATAEPELAARLNVEPGALLLVLLQIDYDARDGPLIVSREHHLADAFAMTVYRKGPHR